MLSRLNAREPVRLNVYLAAAALVAIAVINEYLDTGEWMRAVVAGLVVAVPLLGGAEAARAHAYAPATVEVVRSQAAADAAVVVGLAHRAAASEDELRDAEGEAREGYGG